MYDCLKSSLLDVPEAPQHLEHALWDEADTSHFVLLGEDGISLVYRVVKESMHGPQIALLASQIIDSAAPATHTEPVRSGDSRKAAQHVWEERTPLVCVNGRITWHAPGGQLTASVLCTHTALQVHCSCTTCAGVTCEV